MTVNEFSRRGFLNRHRDRRVVLCNSRWAFRQVRRLEDRPGGLRQRGTGSLLDSYRNAERRVARRIFRRRPSRLVPSRPASARADRRSRRSDLHRIRQLQGVIAESDVVHIALHPVSSALYLAAVQAGNTPSPRSRMASTPTASTYDPGGEDRREETRQRLGPCYRYDILRRQAIRHPQRRDRRDHGRAVRLPAIAVQSHSEKAGVVGNRVSDSQLGTFHLAQRRRDPAVAPAQSRLGAVGWGMSCRRPATRTGGRSSVFSPALGDLFDRVGDLHLRRRQTIYGAYGLPTIATQQYRRFLWNQDAWFSTRWEFRT